MSDIVIPLARYGFAAEVARLVRDARMLMGWTQQELARRARVSQSAISRMERAASETLDIVEVESVLQALGIRAALSLDAHHLDDRRRQRDALHAYANGFMARRCGRQDFLTATEVGVGGHPPRGWIDLLAFRPIDRGLIVDETKTDIPDMGGLQRSLAYYEREAMAAARGLGWDPRRIVVVASVLDTEVVRRRILDSRDLVASAFPGRVSDLARWIEDPGNPPPRGWTLAGIDPASRTGSWLKTMPPDTHRRAPYTGYADAAAALLRRPGTRR